jgi:hypothetical protein
MNIVEVAKNCAIISSWFSPKSDITNRTFMINSCPSKIESLAIPNSIKDDTKGSQDLFGQFPFQPEFDDLDRCSDVILILRQCIKYCTNKPHGVPLWQCNNSSIGLIQIYFALRQIRSKPWAGRSCTNSWMYYLTGPCNQGLSTNDTANDHEY